PPAAKRTEGAHCSTSRTGSGALHVILRNKKLTIRVQNVGQRDCAGLVGAFRKIASPGNRGDFTLQLLQSHLRLRKFHPCVLDGFRGSQGRLTILCKRFGIGAARLSDLGCDLSKIEQAPSQRSRPDGLERLPVKKSAPVDAVKTKSARKRNLRVIIRNRNANSLVRRGKAALGRDNVGTAAQDVERLVGTTNRRNSRNRPRLGELFCVRSRLRADQDIEPVQLRFEGHTQGGHCGLGQFENGLRLGGLTIVCYSHASTNLD